MQQEPHAPAGLMGWIGTVLMDHESRIRSAEISVQDLAKQRPRGPYIDLLHTWAPALIGILALSLVPSHDRHLVVQLLTGGIQ
jgi:hypothetical protein